MHGGVQVILCGRVFILHPDLEAPAVCPACTSLLTKYFPGMVPSQGRRLRSLEVVEASRLGGSASLLASEQL